MSHLLVLADILQTAWEKGEICSLVGRGCRARIMRLQRLVDQGRMTEREALSLATITMHVARSVRPLPEVSP